MPANLCLEELGLDFAHHVHLLKLSKQLLTEEGPHLTLQLRLSPLQQVLRAKCFLELKRSLPDAVHVVVEMCGHELNRAEPIACRRDCDALATVMVFGHAEGECALDHPLEALADFLVVLIVFVDNYEVGDFHHAFLRTLQSVAAARRHNKDDEICAGINRDFILPNAYCLDKGHIESDVLAE